jgi:hypothetical protein
MPSRLQLPVQLPVQLSVQSVPISWWSVLIVEEIGEPGENHRPAASY